MVDFHHLSGSHFAEKLRRSGVSSGKALGTATCHGAARARRCEMPAGVSKSGGGGDESGKARGRTRGRRGGEFSPEWLPPRHQRELLAVTSPSAEGSTLNPGPSRNLRSRIPISSRRQGLTQEFLNREDVRAAAGLGGLGGGGEGVAEVRPGTQEGGEEIAAEVRPGVQEGGEEIAAEVRPGTQQGGEGAAEVRPGTQERGLARALEQLNSNLSTPLTRGEACSMRQKALSGLIEKEASLRLFNAATSERDKARLNCVSREGSGDWLTALPSKALGLHLRMSEFILAVRYRLGLPIFLQEGNCPMNRCRGFGDKYGDHAISCAINGERIAKHNHVRDAIFAAASQAALGPRKEPAGLLPGSDDRPADVLLPFWANGKDAALDISVVNPLQQELVRKVARDGESGVQHSFNIKMGKYSDRCEAEGIEFIPLIVDTFGGWHKESLEVVSKLGRQVSRQTGKEEEEIVRQLRQRVAILLVRDNVNMFDSRTPSFPQAVIDADVDNNY